LHLTVVLGHVDVQLVRKVVGAIRVDRTASQAAAESRREESVAGFRSRARLSV
jgi:hypothetical protein